MAAADHSAIVCTYKQYVPEQSSLSMLQTVQTFVLSSVQYLFTNFKAYKLIWYSWSNEILQKINIAGKKHQYFE